MTPESLSVSVVVITYLRPEFVTECLEHLQLQTKPAEQVIVVDASPDDFTEQAVATFPWAVYVRNPGGVGNMTNSRNVALGVVTGEVIAFLDDDAYPNADYLEQLRTMYSDPSVGLACSRTLNDQPGEARTGVNEIGKLRADGSLTGNFAADPGAVIDIDHGIGATMSFRRSVLADLGSLREDYRGISGVREDADAFFRARQLGFRAVFVPHAIARHVAAPQARGRRFDLRYHHWIHRNHAILIVNNFGATSPLLRRFAVRSVLDVLRSERSLPSRAVRTAVAIAGVVRGLGLCVWRQRGRPLPPAGQDPVSRRLRAGLAAPSAPG